MAQNPNIDDDTRARALKFVADNAGKDEDSDSAAMPRRPVSRTPVADTEPSRMSGPGRKPAGPAAAADPEARDRYGIPTGMGNAGKNYAPTGKAAESASGSELMRNLEAAGNASGASGAIQGVRRATAVGKGLSEFAAGRKAAPAVAKAAEKAAPVAKPRSAAADPKIMEKVNEGIRKAPRPVSKPTASQAEWAKGPKGKLGKGAADTMDEFGAAMKRGGKVEKFAAGGFTRSADGIAQRGKTRAQQFCGGGMSRGKK